MQLVTGSVVGIGCAVLGVVGYAGAECAATAAVEVGRSSYHQCTDQEKSLQGERIGHLTALCTQNFVQLSVEHSCENGRRAVVFRQQCPVGEHRQLEKNYFTVTDNRKVLCWELVEPTKEKPYQQFVVKTEYVQ